MRSTARRAQSAVERATDSLQETHVRACTHPPRRPRRARPPARRRPRPLARLLPRRLGLGVTADGRERGLAAAFLAAGDYHHHIALNTWESDGRATAAAPATPACTTSPSCTPTAHGARPAVQRLLDHGVTRSTTAPTTAAPSPSTCATPTATASSSTTTAPRSEWFDADGGPILKADRFDPQTTLRPACLAVYNCWSSPSFAVTPFWDRQESHGNHTVDPSRAAARVSRPPRPPRGDCERCTSATSSPPTPTGGTRLTAEAAGIYLDYSKNRVADETLRLLGRNCRGGRRRRTAQRDVRRRANQRHRGPLGAARRAPHAAGAHR